ncbi:DUF1150 family protein [Aerobium aerolatum]|uniref:DUF1150 family protein n=1 Tax=Aquamicrobium aerolatum DSM 21857 TaxID=1121003 RepID=A0A1I3PTU0_9HYPH|nr:DUF1150 family protein [Aquamicrobium aerolatum]SFJ24973.1 hypothetical protein SAMN03080618_02445 [Aquamicrobium aerolatum DSM 21857]
MTMTEKNLLTDNELAMIGEGSVAYFKEIDSAELRGKFPGMPDIEPGTRLWAVFAANGRPIMLTDARDAALAGVLQNDLTPVSLH